MENVVKMIRFVDSAEMTIKDTFELVGAYKHLHFGNQVTMSVLERVASELDAGVDMVRVHFDTIGRTQHQVLAHRLMEALGNDFCVIIDYDHYGCEVRKEAPPKHTSDFTRLFKTSYNIEEDITTIWCEQYIGEHLISTRMVSFIYGSAIDMPEMIERVDRDSTEATFLMGQRIIYV